MTPIFDLHSHFSFKPANSRNVTSGLIPDPDHWTERFKRKKEFSKLTRILDKTVVKSSQLHGNAATTGGFRVICNGLYPIERGFLNGVILKEIATLTGYSVQTLKELRGHDRSYFYLLEREYHNLLTNQNKKLSAHGNSYKMVHSFDEVLKALKKDDKTLCILNSVEGIHAFADDLFSKKGYYININREENRFKKSIKARDGNSHFEMFIEAMCMNIDKVKSSWSHTPFFITISHHFYNHIAGHAPSLDGKVDFLANQDGATLDEKSQGPEIHNINYFYLGIQRWGYRIIQQLLYRKDMQGNSVRRILLDLKHMSPQARVDSYRAIEQYSYQLNDRIPIVFSHTGISGRKELKRSIRNSHKLFSDEETNSKYFYDGIINIFDDEIKIIVESDGLIGLMIDERRIMGKVIPPEGGLSYKQFIKVGKENKVCISEYHELKHKHEWGEVDAVTFESEAERHRCVIADLTEKLKPCYLSVIFRQLFHIADVAGKEAWDHVSLGTDYDGVINPIDIYLQSSDMKHLRSDLITFWKHNCSHGTAAIKKLYIEHKYSRSPEYWIDKILWLNGLNFMKKYYNDKYLLEGLPVETGWQLNKTEEKFFLSL